MLKLYTDTKFLTEANRKKVFPLLFDIWFLKSETLKDYYMLVDDAAECDIVVFPIDYASFLKYKSALNYLLQLSKVCNKPIWLYTSGDYGFTVHIPNSFTFRLGGFHSKMHTNTYVLPSFVNDPYQNVLTVPIAFLDTQEKPSIGFVGHANSGVKKYVTELWLYIKYMIKRRTGKILADYQAFYPSSIKRKAYLSKLKASTHLNCNFIYRQQYRAAVKTQEDVLLTSKVFYDNIYANIYTFCMRGVGNFSVRFYETLAVGRIPILLDTDCRLPLDNIITWKKHILVLHSNSSKTLAEQIQNFHHSKTNNQIRKIQESNRNLWLNYLSRVPYFIHIHNFHTL